MLRKFWLGVGAAIVLVACNESPTSVPSPASLDIAGAPLLAKKSRVAVCHRTGQGDYRLIEVSESALPAHLGHGDAQPGSDVPDAAGFEFDDACAPIVSPVVITITTSQSLDLETGEIVGTFAPTADVLIEDLFGILFLGTAPTAETEIFADGSFDSLDAGDFGSGTPAPLPAEPGTTFIIRTSDGNLFKVEVASFDDGFPWGPVTVDLRFQAL